MTDPRTPDGSGSTPPPYTAPAEDPAYAAPATPPRAPQGTPAYGEYAPAPSAYPAPAYPAPAYGAPVAVDPGKTMGIVAFVLAFIPPLQIVGLVLGIVALVQSKKAGLKNGLALAAIIISGVLLLLGILALVAFLAWFGSTGGELVDQINACLDDPSGSVSFNGITMSCEELLDQAGNR